ncbi:MAG: EamA family transporter [Ignavibacteria bacterium]|jgi:drug/metabolite transporter (DMT)-like permease
MGNVRYNIRVSIAFAIIYVVWGTTYLAIRFVLETMPPFMMTGIRFTVAGLLLFTWSYSRYSFKPKLKDLRLPVITGFFMFLVGHGSLAWAEQYISSGFAALEAASIPVWIVLLSWMQSRSNKPNKFTVTGIILGITGVALLIGTGGDFSINPSASSAVTIISIVLLVMGTISWAAGSIQSRKINKDIPLLYTTSIQMLTGGVSLLLLAFIDGEVSQISVANVSFISIVSLLYLIVFGSIIAYSSYLWLMNQCAPAKVSTYAFVNPLIAVFLGWVLVDEPITHVMILGAAAILFSVLLINRSFSINKMKAIFLTKPKFVNEPESPGVITDCDGIQANNTAR